MKKNKSALTFFGIVTIYFILDYFFDQSMMYLVSGIVLGTLKELLNEHTHMYMSLISWAVLLFVVVFLFYRLKSGPLVYLLGILTGMLLYPLDIITYDLLSLHANKNVIVAVTILSKSLLLFFIVWGRNYFQHSAHSSSRKSV